MTTLTSRAATSAPSAPLRALATLEARRYARHPLFLAGVALLAAGGDDDVNQEQSRSLARLLSVYSTGRGLYQVAFGENDPLHLDGDFIVFDIPEINLPPRESLESEVLARRLLPEQIFSQALLYLITAVMGEVALSDRSRYSMVVIDEGYALAASPEGTALLTKVAKDGRKHNAGLLYLTHLPSEIPEAVSDALSAKFLFRMSRRSAPEGLRWLGLPATSELVDVIAEDARGVGECLMVDRHGRAGLVGVLEPHTPELVAAFNTGLHAAGSDITAPGDGDVSERRSGVVGPATWSAESQPHAVGARTHRLPHRRPPVRRS